MDLNLLGTPGDVMNFPATDETMMQPAAVGAVDTSPIKAYSDPSGSMNLALSSIAQAIREPAKSADSFVDSIGVNTHLRYTDTSYGKFSEVVEPRLKELGIRHIRDGGNNQELFTKICQLAADGIRTDLVMDPRDNSTPDNVVQQIQQALPGVEAVEGPNEWDVNSNVSYKGESFPNGLRDYQTDLYNAVKSNPSTSNIAVIAPSMAYPENDQKVGSIAQYSDYGNMHSYAGGNAPGQDFDWRWMPLTKAYAGDRPIVATETGYHNAVNDPSAAQKGVTEAVAAKYIPRTVLENFNRGVQRTDLYELLDEHQADNQENNFGLIHADGTPKPAFDALRNLIGLLNDKPGSTASGALSYYFSGNVQNLHHTLLEKSNGDFYLVMWLNSPSTDAPITQRVTLNLLTPTQQAATYLPNRSTDATATFTAPTRITMDVPDSPMVVKVTPKST